MIKLNNKRIAVVLPTFINYTAPRGFLVNDPACQALFYYYLCARQNWEEEFHGIVLEGDPDPVFNYHNLFKSIAKLYDVPPERMIHFWINVDMQCRMLDTPLLPPNDRYRFNKIPEIKTNG